MVVPDFSLRKARKQNIIMKYQPPSPYMDTFLNLLEVIIVFEGEIPLVKTPPYKEFWGGGGWGFAPDIQ